MLKKIILLWIIYNVAFSDGKELLLKFLQKQHYAITANFIQKIYNKKSTQISFGKMSILRPNKFKWEYFDHDNKLTQLIICNGKNIFVIDPQLQEVNIKKLTTLSKSNVAAILASAIPIEKIYNLQSISLNDDLEWVLLTSKYNNDDGIKLIRIGFAKKTQLINKIYFEDAFGGKSELIFQKVNMQAFIKNSDFKYFIPKGYDVIGDE